jgi:hypothetical protein
MKVAPDEAQRVLQHLLDNLGKLDIIDRGHLLHAIRADRRKYEKELEDV